MGKHNTTHNTTPKIYMETMAIILKDVKQSSHIQWPLKEVYDRCEFSHHTQLHTRYHMHHSEDILLVLTPMYYVWHVRLGGVNSHSNTKSERSKKSGENVQRRSSWGNFLKALL